MRKPSILLALFIIGIMSVSAASEKHRKIVFKVIHSWDRSERSVPIIPIEADLDNANLRVQFYGKEQTAITITVLDDDGNVVCQNEFNPVYQDCCYISVQEFPQGNYTLLISDEHIEISGNFEL